MHKGRGRGQSYVFASKKIIGYESIFRWHVHGEVSSSPCPTRQPATRQPATCIETMTAAEQYFIESITEKDGHRPPFRMATAPETMMDSGQVISREEPFAAVLMRSHAHKYCAHCFAKFDNESPGKRCSGGCEFTYYCGRQCQKKHHGTVHKHTCKRYAAIVGQATQFYSSTSTTGDEFPFEDFMLGRAVYIVMCARSGFSVKEHKLDGLAPVQISALCEGLETSVKEEERLLAHAIAASFGFEQNKRPKAITFFTSLLLKFRHNNFGIQNELQQVIASGVFPRGAILNHSCDPNCMLTYDGPTQIITTTKPVSEGEELFHSYTDICQPTAVRQESLFNTYGFRCDCVRYQGLGQWKLVEGKLVGGNDSLSDEDTKTISLSLLMAQKISSESADEDDDLLREYNLLRKVLAIQTEALDRFNTERYKTECLALSVALLLGSEEALSHARAIVDFLAFVCNGHHPLLLLQRRTLSELEGVFGDK